MAINNELKTKIVLRNDLAATWTEKNPELLPGEIGIENDTGLFKIGVEGKSWSELSYANQFENVDLSAVTNSYQQVAKYEDLVDGKAIGDVGVVKAHIANNDSLSASYYSYTCYIWDGTQWAAADGNYNASNVIFDEDLTYTTSIGALKLASGKSSDTYAAKGKSLEDLMKRIMAETIDPTVTYPTASMTAHFTPSTLEVGESTTKVGWNGSSSVGKYNYGTNTNSTANSTSGATVSWVVKNKDGEQISTKEDDSIDYVIEATDTTQTYAFSSTATVTPAADGTYIPLNNIGGTVDNLKIAGFDKAGTKTKTFTPTASITGYRKPFWGYKLNTEALDPTKLTSANIRALRKSGASTDALPGLYYVPENTQQVYFAALAGTKNSLSVKNFTKDPATSVAVQHTNVDVEGANGASAKSYDVWYINLDAPFTAEETRLQLIWG